MSLVVLLLLADKMCIQIHIVDVICPISRINYCFFENFVYKNFKNRDISDLVLNSPAQLLLIAFYKVISSQSQLHLIQLLFNVAKINSKQSFLVTFIFELVKKFQCNILFFWLFEICKFQLEWDPKKIRQEMKEKDKEQQQQVRQCLFLMLVPPGVLFFLFNSIFNLNCMIQ